MTPDEARRAEAVDRAVGALLAGADRGEVTAGLPPGVHRLLDAAVALREARLGGGGPRPSFVLSLEDDLRTDLRLQVQSRAPAGGSKGRVLLGVAVGLLLVLVFMAGQAVPGDGLYGLKRGMEEIRAGVAAALSPASSPGAADFTVGRRRLGEVGVLVADRRRGGSALDWLLDDLLASYARGVVEAARSEDPAAMIRARVEVRAAEVELSRLDNNVLPAADREAVAETRQALMRLLAPLEPARETPPPTSPPAATEAPSPTQASPATEPVLTATATATVWLSPTATATATATPTRTPSPAPESPRRPREPEPSNTPVALPPATLTPGVVVTPSPTADRWPTETPPGIDPGGPTAEPTPTDPGTGGTATARPPRDG